MAHVALLLALLVAQAAPPATTAAAADAATAAREAAEAAQRAAEAAQKAAAAAAALAGTPPAAAPAAAPAAPPPVSWTGAVTLGFIALTGNSQTLTFSAGGNFERKTAEWIWGVKASAAYGQSTITSTTASGAAAQVNAVTALSAGLQARGDRRFTDQLSLYLMAGIDADHLKSVEDRPFGELGVSLIWFDTKEGDLSKSSLKTDLGFRYGREYRFAYYPAPPDPRAELPEVDVVAPRVGLTFRYAISKDVIFTEELSALGNVVGQARLLFSSASKLTARLTEKVSLGVGFVFNDDTVPAPGKVSGDTATTVGLEMGI
jgi:putative salt-induced outer membrane protein YdiY